ncbi:MAG: YfcE family phosphodiesterase [Candidatus Thorarchaeota archaeon]
MRVLVFGDTHIPSRRDAIPEYFYKHIENTIYDLALITGDLVQEHEMRNALPPLPRAFIVRGNMDYSTSAHNFHEQVQIESFNVLLLHGTQLKPRGNIKQLWEVANNIGAQVAVHGHTHETAVDLYQNKLFLNPGTISGATGGWGGRTSASFIELNVSGINMAVLLHKTDWEISKVTEAHFLLDGQVVKRFQE